MFGYVTTNMEEMKVKDYRKYRAFYCGICQTERISWTAVTAYAGLI